jgi:hypothetical protein
MDDLGYPYFRKPPYDENVEVARTYNSSKINGA